MVQGQSGHGFCKGQLRIIQGQSGHYFCKRQETGGTGTMGSRFL